MKIAVSIVEFNTKELLRECLKSVLSQKKSDIEVWVVDNASEDFSAEMVEKDFPKVNLIKNKENSGFAKGHNMALKKILPGECNLVLILNSDAKIEEDVVTRMAGFMEENPDCGIASCRIDGPEGFQPNGGDLPLGPALFSWLFNLEILGNLPNFHRNEKSYYQNAHEVGWVSGSFMIVRKEVFERIGLLNEDYFMYFEDVEYCYKARKNGFKVMINPLVRAYHVGGASSKDPRFKQWKGEIKGLLYFYSKQFGKITAFCLKLVVFLSLALRMAAFGLLGRFNAAVTYGKILVSL